MDRQGKGKALRVAKAKLAAQARWKPEVLVLAQPRDGKELQCFVAQYGSGYAQHGADCDPTAVLVQALSACRSNACLARMLPVFIWRASRQIFGDPTKLLTLLTVSTEEACALGYFLELTKRFGNRVERPREASRDELNLEDLVADLRRKTRSIERPFVWFRSMDASVLREHAARLTSATASSWNLILGEPDESFEGYFNRAVTLGNLRVEPLRESAIFG